MHLELLDIIVICLYFVGLIALGVVSSRRQETQEDYFLAGRRVPSLLAGISVVATLLSTVTFVALPGETIRNGIGYFSSLLAFIFIIPVVNRTVIPALMRLPVTSIYDYLQRRFGKPARLVGAIVFVLTRLIWMGLILYTAARALAPMTGWNMTILIVAMGIVTMIYTTVGGMRAVIWSDFAQFTILVGGAILVPCYIAVATSSWPSDWLSLFSDADRASTPIFSFDPTVRTTMVGMVLALFTWNICTHCSDQVAAQRYLSTGSIKHARRSFWIFSLGNVGVILLLMVSGLSLFYFRFNIDGLPMAEFQRSMAAEADNVMPEFIARQLPAGVSGLILAALLAAAMSSISSGINSISAVAISDLLVRTEQEETGSESLAAPRVLAILSGSVAVGGAICVNWLMEISEWNLVELFERTNHLFVAPLGAMFFAGIWFRRVGLTATLLGFTSGLLASILMSFSEWIFHYDLSFMWILPGSFLVSIFVAYVSGPLLGRPTDAQLAVLFRAGERFTQRPKTESGI